MDPLCTCAGKLTPNYYQAKRATATVDTLLLDAGNLFLFLSGFLMLYTAYRDRKILRGYNLPGTILIVLAIGLALAYYAQQGYWLSFALTLPNYTYWLIVCTSIIKRRFSSIPALEA
jgi:hypothetical protein